jgi:hypothetical protein
MRFESYILTENRSEEIDEKNALKTIEKYCSKALNIANKGSKIFRGLGNNAITLFIDPVKFTRVSGNTANYYTLLIDNSPAWKEYPKRSKSIICATDHDVANHFGFVYLVLPYDGSKIGVCPHEDIWAATLEKYKYPLDGFNGALQNFLNNTLGIDLDDYDDTWKVFKEKIDNANKKLKEIFKTKDKESVLASFNNNFHIKYNIKKTFLNNLLSIVDPNGLGFKLVKAGDKLPSYNEVWTDGKSILVSTDSDLYRELIPN